MRMFRHTFQLLLAGSVIASSACVGTYPPDPYIVSETRQRENSFYVPASVKAPLLSRANELGLAFCYAGTKRYGGIDMQAAYAAGKHLAFTATAQAFHLLRIHSDDYTYSSDHFGGNTSRFGLGTGYFNQSGVVHVEAYGGWESGHLSNNHHTGRSGTRFTDFYVQPAIAVQNSSNTFQFALVSRMTAARLHLTNSTVDRSREPFVTTQLDILETQQMHWIWQPALVLRAGTGNFQFRLGYAGAADLTEGGFHFERRSISVGIVFQSVLGHSAQHFAPASKQP